MECEIIFQKYLLNNINVSEKQLKTKINEQITTLRKEESKR